MDFLKKATPESCGISSKSIIKFIESLCQVSDNQETHSFLLLRHGKLDAIFKLQENRCLLLKKRLVFMGKSFLILFIKFWYFSQFCKMSLVQDF